MKLVRYGPAGKEKPGLIDADGKLRDLSRKVRDIDATTLSPAKLKELGKHVIGLGMKPTPQYLKAGDIVTLGIQGLGEQRQKIVPFKKGR